MTPVVQKTICQRTLDGMLMVRCPMCRQWQPFVLAEDEYAMDQDGRVWPDFVCMTEGRHCPFMGPIRIVNL